VISSIYGVDILEDTQLNGRDRLFQNFLQKIPFYFWNKLEKADFLKIGKVYSWKNILWGDAFALQILSVKTNCVF